MHDLQRLNLHVAAILLELLGKEFTFSEKIRPLSGGQGWLRPQRSFTGSGEGMMMPSLKLSLRFRWPRTASAKDSLYTEIGILKVYIWGYGGLGPSLVNCRAGSGFASSAS